MTGKQDDGWKRGGQLEVRDLITRCCRRPIDEIAWHEFVRRFHDVIKSTVLKAYHRQVSPEAERREMVTEEVADDLAQVVYWRLIIGGGEALSRFKGRHENSIYQYLMMISINVVRDHFREIRALKRPKISYSLDELVSTEDGKAPAGDNLGMPSSSPQFTIEEIESALRRAASDRNRDRDILIFKLRYVDGLTLDEIIRVMKLGLSSGGLNSILTRLVGRMRMLLIRK